MRAAATTSLLVLLASSGCSNDSSARPQPIIDVHLHAYPDAEFSEDLPNPVNGLPTNIRTAEEHMRATAAEMSRLNIVRGIVSAGSGRPEVALLWSHGAPELFLASARFDAPDVFVASVGFEESTVPLSVADLRRAFAEGHYMAMGEVSAQYAGLSLSDPRFDPYLALAEELGVPIGLHTGISFPGISYQPCCRGFRTMLGNPVTVEDALNRHPRLRFNLMHAGWPYTQETIALMSVYPQVYADLAAINWIIPREAFHEHLKALIRAGLGERLMFGSDQMRWPEALGMAVEGIRSAAFLTEQQKADIFCNNAARFFGWEKADNPCQP